MSANVHGPARTNQSHENNADGASRRTQGGERANAEGSGVACLGNTLPSHSIPSPDELVNRGVVAIDWLETAGVVEWDPEEGKELRQELQAAWERARDSSEPQTITLHEAVCQIYPKGMGTGKQTRLQFRLEWGNITIGLDFRENATRQLSNFSLTVPGRACLLNGALAVRNWISRVITSLGGTLTDEWLRRLDICIDLPGIQASTLLELCEKRQFIASSRAIQFHYDGEAATSFTLGNRKSVQMQIYDKLQEVRYKNDPEYHAAMQIFRWKEKAPQGATRVEIRIYRDWFAKWQNTEVDNVIKCLGSVLYQLLVDTTRPMFRLLAQTPDRKNNHQSKCDVHPLWELIREKMIREAGNEPLMLQRKLRKGDIDVSRAAKMAAAFVITAAVQRGIGIDSLDDLIEEFRQLAYLNLSNDTVATQYQKKAVVAGISNPGIEFDFGANVASF